jgi:methylmalonyl-CoA mutase
MSETKVNTNKKLFSIFPYSAKQEWESLLIKELKGADFNQNLKHSDRIEEISFDKYNHASDTEHTKEEKLHAFKYTNLTNAWFNNLVIDVIQEKQANSIALDKLMKGVNALTFNLSDETSDWDQLFNTISFSDINTTICIQNIKQFQSLSSYVLKYKVENIRFNFDFNSNKEFNEQLSEISSFCINNQIPFIHINAFQIHQLGANIKQELTFAIDQAHRQLVYLLEKNVSISKACNLIHFTFGVGSNYFYEIAKFRTFKRLWLNILSAYNSNNETIQIHMDAKIGHVNKSLNDPYTNLLRQTTETMSALLGGVEKITVSPYDSISIAGPSIIADRMATNIPLILEHESFFDKVIDPLNGSYSIINLTNQLCEITWDYLTSIDELGGLNNYILNTDSEAIENFKNDITTTQKLRIEEIKTNNKTLIGINKFKNPEEPTKNQWKKQDSFFGLTPLILENELNASI